VDQRVFAESLGDTRLTHQALRPVKDGWSTENRPPQKDEQPRGSAESD